MLHDIKLGRPHGFVDSSAKFLRRRLVESVVAASFGSNLFHPVDISI
jgi:hypothetical protein